MSIRPIDTLVMPQRSHEASQVKQADALKSPTQQAQINHSFQGKIQHDAHQTVQTTKSDKKEKKYDAKEKGNGAEHDAEHDKKRSEQKNEKKSETPLRDIRMSSFDIKI